MKKIILILLITISSCAKEEVKPSFIVLDIINKDISKDLVYTFDLVINSNHPINDVVIFSNKLYEPTIKVFEKKYPIVSLAKNDVISVTIYNYNESKPYEVIVRDIKFAENRITL